MSKAKQSASKERAKLLEQLYDAHLRALIEQLKDPSAVTAATLGAVQAALRENSVNIHTLAQPEREQISVKELAAEIREVPNFPSFYA